MSNKDQTTLICPFIQTHPCYVLHCQNAPLNCIRTLIRPLNQMRISDFEQPIVFYFPTTATWQICVILWPTLSPRTATQGNQHGPNHFPTMSGVWLQVLYCSGRGQETKVKLCLENLEMSFTLLYYFPKDRKWGRLDYFSHLMLLLPFLS